MGRVGAGGASFAWRHGHRRDRSASGCGGSRWRPLTGAWMGLREEEAGQLAAASGRDAAAGAAARGAAAVDGELPRRWSATCERWLQRSGDRCSCSRCYNAARLPGASGASGTERRALVTESADAAQARRCRRRCRACCSSVDGLLVVGRARAGVAARRVAALAARSPPGGSTDWRASRLGACGCCCSGWRWLVAGWSAGSHQRVDAAASTWGSVIVCRVWRS